MARLVRACVAVVVAGDPSIEETQAKLTALQAQITATDTLASTLTDLRRAAVSGEYIGMPSARWALLEQSIPQLAELVYDEKHAPLVQPTPKHFNVTKFASSLENLLFAEIMPLKGPPKGSEKGAPKFAIVIASSTHVGVLTSQGQQVHSFEAGHAKPIKTMTLSTSLDEHLLLTADTDDQIRVHEIKLHASKTEDEIKVDAKSTFIGEFEIPPASGEQPPRKLTSMLVVAQKAGESRFMVGDSDGGVSMFYSNGTLRGRVVVADEGPIVKLAPSSGMQAIFLAERSFGFVSFSTVDVMRQPCVGWGAAAVDITPDVAYPSRMYISLSDGSVIAMDTMQGQQKICDLKFKLPHVSRVPLHLKVIKGYALGLQRHSDLPKGPLRLWVFNLIAIETGYGSQHSRAVVLTKAMEQRPRSLSLFRHESSKSRGSFCAVNEDGSNVELWDLQFKAASAPRAATEGDNTSWLDSIPQSWIFIVVIIGVAIWNVRKQTSKKQASSDFDSLEDRKKLEAALKRASDKRAQKMAQTSDD